MNYLVRVVTRIWRKGKLKTDKVVNHVINSFSARKALKELRQAYGSTAIFGFVRKTNLEEGIYFPQEKELVVHNEEARQFVLDSLKKKDKQWLTSTQSQFLEG